MDGRTLWVHHDDVAGRLDEGCVVTGPHTLSAIGACAPTTASSRSRPARCWRSIEARPWGAAMAQELPHDEPMTVLDELIAACARARSRPSACSRW